MRARGNRCTVRRMWRRLPPLPRPSRLDWAIALVGAGLTELVVWTSRLGTHVAGPHWFTASLPLLLDVPLAWRRLVPLPAWLLVLSGLVLHPLVTGHSAEGVELLYPAFVGAYSVGAYANRAAATAGVAALVPAWTFYAYEDPGVRTNSGGAEWAAAFFGLWTVALWLAGLWMHGRRETAALEREATAAVSEERAKMARELHDIVSHNLSVVVTQAAGARAAGAAPDTLEKIERSGREALVEMRRLLGVLREDADGAAIAPQPGVAELDTLAANLRAAGVDVELSLDERCSDLPPALELAVYRIVQEALTNALKHAAAAHVLVSVRRERGGVRVEIVDDGSGAVAHAGAGGHGLVGMRERVALFGGELLAGPRAEGGFGVSAMLPLAP